MKTKFSKVILLIIAILCILGISVYAETEEERETRYEAYSTLTKSVNGVEQTPVRVPGVYKLTINEESGTVEYTLIVTEDSQYDAGHMYKRGDRLLPEHLFVDGYGLLPQYFGREDQEKYVARNVDLESGGNRWDLSTRRWLANVNGSVVYCRGYNMPVKFSEFDEEVYPIPAVGTAKLRYTREASLNYEGLTLGYQAWEGLKAIKKFWVKNLNDNNKRYYSNPGRDRTGDILKSSNSVEVTYEYSGTNVEGVPLTYNSLCAVNFWNATGELNAAFFKDQEFDRREYALRFQGAMKTVMETMQNANAGHYGGGFYVTKDGGMAWSPEHEVKPTKTADHGELIMSVETEEHLQDGYKWDQERNYDDNWYSFIFSASENAYGLPAYSRKYSLTDIQSAYWLLLYEHGVTSDRTEGTKGKKPREENLQPMGKVLRDKANEYVEFLNEIESGYSAKINDSVAQVIVDRTNRQYILGPYSLDYKYIEDINYVKALTITAGGTELVYAEAVDGKTNYDFKIVLDGEGVKSNGMLKEYPNQGQSFFILLDANKIGLDTTKITFGAKFEHIEKSHAHTEEYASEVNNYQYAGFYRFTGDYECEYCGETHKAATGHITYTVKWKEGGSKSGTDHSKDKQEWNDPNDHSKGTYTDHSGDVNYTDYWNDEIVKVYRVPVSVAYIKMADKVLGTQHAQPLTVTGKYYENQTEQMWGDLEAGYDENAWREYVITEDSVDIDLSMELGGHVFLDVDSGKEGEYNGIYSADENEVKVPNVKVNLYRASIDKVYDTVFVKETYTSAQKTAELEVGEYRFKDLSPMFLYYVSFTYNGQYYEPTRYTSPKDTTNGWAKGNWKINSNATDKRGERVAFNNRFGTINSANKNYVSASGQERRTFTKMELLGYTLQDNGEYSPKPVVDEKTGLVMPASGAVIDQFGNLIKGATGDKANYVIDSQMIATTQNLEGVTDFYPTPDIFVIDDELLESGQYSALINNQYYPRGNTIVNQLTALYPHAYYINLGLHPRQQSDIAVKQDIQKVTLEINNHTHEYTYDTLDTFKCKNGHTGKNSDLKYELDPTTFRWSLKCPDCGTDEIEANWDIEVRLAEAYYDKEYSRGLYKSDWIYKVSEYGKNYEDYGKRKSDELEVYVTYKIRVQNQSKSIRMRVDELVDYFDETYVVVPERSYIEIEKGDSNGRYDIVIDENSSECKDTAGENKLFIRGIGKDDADSIYLSGGQSACFYVTFRVKKEERDGEKWIILGEKGNLVEVNGYSTRYEKGTKIPNAYDEFTGFSNGTPNDTITAGIVDFNSTPGNQERDGKLIENDTDKAPPINIHLLDDEYTRIIEGLVWEDERTKEVNAATIADGEMNPSDTKINGVTVQLVEIMEKAVDEAHKEFVWREFGSTVTGEGTINNGTGSGTRNVEIPVINYNNMVENYTFEGNYEGKYAFKSFMPGNYVIRFIYGDTVRTVVPSELNNDSSVSSIVTDTTDSVNKGLNAKSYNGNDYKSTTYQNGIDQSKPNYVWEQQPVKVMSDGSGNLVLWDEKEENRWQYAYVLWDEANKKYIFKPEWISGEKQPAPKLTEVSTYKDNENTITKNETVTLPDATEVTTTRYENGEIIKPTELTAGYTRKYQKGYLYDISASDAKENVSDAKDIESIRRGLDAYTNDRLDKEDGIGIDYSDREEGEDEGIKNHKAEVLASHKIDYKPTNNDRAELLQELMEKTKMTAETGLMVIEFEYDDVDTDIKDDFENDRQGKYEIKNVNLGLEERPESQLAINKEVTNIKVTLANGSILFDAKEATNNVLWRRHVEYDTGYDGNMLDNNKFGSIEHIRSEHAKNYGLIQLTMDEEIMHGATITIDYKVTVRNVGEVDYDDNRFYYLGATVDERSLDTSKVVTTRANKVLDYVANNLQFNANQNKEWSVISNKDITSNKYVNEKIIDDGELDKINTIIITDKLSANLVPEKYKEAIFRDAQDEISVPLTLSQLITSENDTDDLTYGNKVEIIETSNTVGRRNEFSVAGNQNPSEDPQEMDSDESETVRILPPFGETSMYLLISIIAIISIGIIVIAIVFIKKKILK
ncbi:MAG: hypothetical protein J6M60_02635 [Clostridia bacterium]|nr:hypothetical protein [Clostridia bacterium]